MSSLSERLKLLEDDLKAVPPRIAVCHDLPFAILRYDPSEEWQLRRELRLLQTRLEAAQKTVHVVRMSDLLWQAIAQSEGLDALVQLERQWGFLPAQEQVTCYLSDRDWCPLADLVLSHYSGLHPARDIVFLTRVAALAPGLYPVSKLLDELHGRTQVPTVLFYPGSREGTFGLRLMNLKDRLAWGNYRVKIYG
ncbi:MAG: DUF1788 domain-containing protein [Gemmatales bacterium]|nr:DUF1788 domain-containing protein [Gemmatales bacterium]MDW7993068.1 DUF1788 domain-containing protein [Gemmatales bacterium]